jgi:2-keto-4-pentenoate hydratase/2-oxohepta-3-ene-1,7-dioic acid hydratase in catechol pathway
MKLASVRIGDRDTYGIVREDEFLDVGAALKGKFPTLKSALAAGALDDVAGAADSATEHSLGDIASRPVITEPGKIVCVGLNYEDHRIETGREPSGYPVLFSRFADCQCGHEEAMIRPRNSDKFDYEGELAAIIGRRGRHVSQNDALSIVAGYACYNDGSIRDFQSHTHQFLPGKNFPGTGAFGPWMVTADEIPDPSKLELTTRLNGEQMQHAFTDQMIFNVPFLISYLSSFMALEPGDVIVTGTPGGVGFKRNPPVFMKAGDIVEVEISGIGTLKNPIKDEAG